MRGPILRQTGYECMVTMAIYKRREESLMELFYRPAVYRLKR